MPAFDSAWQGEGGGAAGCRSPAVQLTPHVDTRSVHTLVRLGRGQRYDKGPHRLASARLKPGASRFFHHRNAVFAPAKTAA